MKLLTAARIRQMRQFVSQFFSLPGYLIISVVGCLLVWQIWLTREEVAAYRSSGLDDTTPASQPIKAAWPEYHLRWPAEVINRPVVVSFEYRCLPECGPLWLGYQKADGQWMRVVLSHPVLNQVNWIHNFSNGWFLYQRQLRYPSLAAFGKQLPAELWLADSQLLELSPQLPGQPLDGLRQPGEVNYIVTSWQPARQVDGWYQFRRQFLITQPAVDSQNRVIAKLWSRSDFDRFDYWIRKFEITDQ